MEKSEQYSDNEGIQLNPEIFSKYLVRLKELLDQCGSFEVDVRAFHSVMFPSSNNEKVDNMDAQLLQIVNEKFELLKSIRAKCQKVVESSHKRQELQSKLIKLHSRSLSSSSAEKELKETSHELLKLNKDCRSLEPEVLGKCEAIFSEEPVMASIFHREIHDFNQVKLKHHLAKVSGLISALGIGSTCEGLVKGIQMSASSEASRFGSSTLLDEWLKFQMRLEAKVVEKQHMMKVKSGGDTLSSGVSVDDTSTKTSYFSSRQAAKKSDIQKQKKSTRQNLAFVPVYSTIVSGMRKKDKEASTPADIRIENPEKEKSNSLMKALYDYAAQQLDEVSLRVGELYEVLKKNEDGWFEVQALASHARGMCPGNYLAEMDRSNNI